MNQAALFHDTIYDAIGADIAAAGGFKAVAGKLWPSVPDGGGKLRNCVNPDQPHKLSPDEVMQIKRLAHAVGSFATVTYESQQLGYRIEWLDPESEKEQLDRDIRDLLQVVLKKQEQRERAEQRASTQLKAVR